jgi:hypothetical protein
MSRWSKTTTVLAVLIPVVAAAGLADSISVGAATQHPSSSHPSTAKLQKEITALKRELPTTYVSVAKAKKTYLTSSQANKTYLSQVNAASTLIHGHGTVIQDTVSIANGDNEPSTALLATPSGATFSVETASGDVTLIVQNNSSQDQTLILGNAERDLPAGEITPVVLGTPTESGEYVMSILRSTSPLQIDTLTLGKSAGSGSSIVFFAQLVHSG